MEALRLDEVDVMLLVSSSGVGLGWLLVRFLVRVLADGWEAEQDGILEGL